MISLKTFFLFLLICSNMAAQSQEICNNAVDDDQDGLIDLNDTADCACYGIGDSSHIPSSLIPNPSFEDMDCCPQSYSELSCATGWEQATEPTTDYMNTCGYITNSTTVAGLIPFPDGNGAVGAFFRQDWMEYLGCCPTEPLLAGTSYTLQFNIAATMSDYLLDACSANITSLGPVEVSIFGNPACVPFPISTYGCPPGWTLLGSATYTPAEEWSEITITFYSSVDIYSIMIGPPCNLPAGYIDDSENCGPYFLFDYLVLNESSLFNSASLSQAGGFCSNDIVLTAETDTAGGTWQWYRNGIALVGETDSLLSVSVNSLGEGNYSAVYTVNGQCEFTNGITVFSMDDYLPDADFSATAICVGGSSNFTDESTIALGSIAAWNWNFGDASQESNLQDPIHTYTNPGTYTVTLNVSSDENCTNSVSQTVTVFEPPEIITGNDTTICAGELAQLYASGASSYSWSPQLGLINANSANPMANPFATTEYIVTATDTNSCISTSSQLVTVTDTQTLSFSVEWKLDCNGLLAEFTNTSQTNENLHWDFGDESSSILENPTHVFAYDNEFTVTLFGATCHYSAQTQVSIIPFIDTLLQLIPDIITPNNDNLNDCFSPDISNLLSECSEITVYSRWGRLVFKKEKGEQTCWDGKNKSDKTYLDAGTYFYVMKVNDLDVKHGTVTLIR